MSSPQPIFTGLLALLLPMALLSVFIGCVQSCSAQSAEALEYHTPNSVEKLAVADDCQRCPLSNELSYGLPARQYLLPQTNDDEPPVFAPASLLHGNGSYFRASLLMPHPGYDPPLERLFVLRI
ncbi:MAG: hypothetical protein H0T64_10260 [Pyrinomonadaceae bacterium]|nr:hypothetical protein [Pyrinomonadaceae bacterium]MDQ3173014.1 hypothetical protein [Acidobacteriota bacterium]